MSRSSHPAQRSKDLGLNDLWMREIEGHANGDDVEFPPTFETRIEDTGGVGDSDYETTEKLELGLLSPEQIKYLGQIADVISRMGETEG